MPSRSDSPPDAGELAVPPVSRTSDRGSGEANLQPVRSLMALLFAVGSSFRPERTRPTRRNGAAAVAELCGRWGRAAGFLAGRVKGCWCMLVLVIDQFAKEYLHSDLREIREVMLRKLDGLSEYDIRRP